MNEKNPDLAYSHPSHEAFNKQLEAQVQSQQSDVTAPWVPPNTPALRRDFDLLDTYLTTSPEQQQESQDKGGSGMVQEDHLAPTLVPPPHLRNAVLREHFNTRWNQELLAHRNAVMEQLEQDNQKQRSSEQERRLSHQFNQPSTGDNTMSNETNNQNSNGPLETYRDQGVNVKLWQNQGKDGNVYVNASIGKSYKDKNDQWRESRNFSPSDLAKLQQMLPEALEQAQAHEHALNAHRMEQSQTVEPSQTQSVPAQQQPNQVLSQQDMVQQRESVMQQASVPNSAPQHTQEHAPDNAPELKR